MNALAGSGYICRDTRDFPFPTHSPGNAPRRVGRTALRGLDFVRWEVSVVFCLTKDWENDKREQKDICLKQSSQSKNDGTCCAEGV